MQTYQDLQKMGDNESARMAFVYKAINEHIGSPVYKTARDAELYACGMNVTISRYQKLLYTLAGDAVPDNISANHKCKSKFFKLFTTQETAFEVGNGVSFKNAATKQKLGADIDTVIYRAVKAALIEGVAFCFYNADHIELFKLTEFVPLYDEETGALRAGIRFWQISPLKPLRAVLYEVDGYTEYKKTKEKMEILQEKRTYKSIIKVSEATGTQIIEGQNYPGFPIIPLFGNDEHQSELVGIQENIDCYDLIKSGFANDIDDASMIYWTLKNTGGMEDDESLAKFVEHMKTIHAAVVSTDGEEGGEAEAHTMEPPSQSREICLKRIEHDLYRDCMALDVTQIAAGAVTATQIQAAYEPLNEKADELEMCLCDFFKLLLQIVGIDDDPVFERSKISNQPEFTQMVLSAAEYLDDETILQKLPFVSADEIKAILKKKDEENNSRFQKLAEQMIEQENKQKQEQQQNEDGGDEE